MCVFAAVPIVAPCIGGIYLHMAQTHSLNGDQAKKKKATKQNKTKHNRCGRADSHSSSSSSRWWCGPCLASPAGPRHADSLAPAGSRHGKPWCRSGRGKGRQLSRLRTRRTSRRWKAEVRFARHRAKTVTCNGWSNRAVGCCIQNMTLLVWRRC